MEKEVMNMEKLLEEAKKLGIKVTEDMKEDELLKLIEERKKEIQKQNDDATITNSMLMW